MARISEVDRSGVNGYADKVLAAQESTWGAPLNNHMIYAHRPALFKAVRGMWAAIDSESLLGESLVSLLNRRIAWLNGCEF